MNKLLNFNMPYLSKGGMLGALSGAGGGGFAPTDIDGCEHWYDSSVLDDITKDGSNRVSQWNDKVGSDNLVQSTSSNQPLWVNDGQNGHDYIDFDSTARYMQTSSGWTSMAQPMTVCMAIEFPSAERCAFSGFNSGASTWLRLMRGSNTNQVACYNGADFGGTSITGLDDAKHTFMVISDNAGDDLIYMDGNNVTTDDSGGSNAFVGLTIGAQQDGSSGWGSAIYEWFIYDSVLSSDNLATVNTYLSDKWGL